ncbi:hypothetical protein GYMLUDRAFT_242602 [Collybiopsis luxurians FD-317 M1]|uniref:Uncharacterized protein n=1 Tax=Collybiopsis luxurians FD-317 M1 TaxID=944289 RepID=A0A0D0CIC0_9AGAR|nr:hypothetical protein GYMLUDRAFT_242602 [Collybiopsis luxurians FD-317 M1]
MRVFIFSFLSFLFALVYAQTETQTVEDANGNTVVEVISENRQGLFTTATITTILAGAATTLTSTSTTSTTSTTATTLQQGGGVVGQPAPTPNGDPHGPTPYTYTTVIGGVTTAVEAIFTPSFTTPVATPAPATGTILDYSSWLAQFGATSSASSASRVSLNLSGLGQVMVTMAAGIVMGGLAILS